MSMAAGLLAAALFALCAPGARAASAGDEVLATVGGESITRAYLAEAELMQGAGGKAFDRQTILRHLADRKALALASFADADAAEREAVAARLGADEGVRLAAIYRAVEVEAKIEPVTDAEIAAAVPRFTLYDLTQYTFRDPGHARVFLEKHREQPEAFSTYYTNLRYKDLNLTERYLTDQAPSLRVLKAGEFSAPVRWGREFTAVFKAEALRQEDDAALAKRRAEARKALAARRRQVRFNEVLTALRARYSYREVDDQIAMIRNKKSKVADLDGGTVLATRDGATYRAADLLRDLGAYKVRSTHGAFEAVTVVKIFHEAVQADLFAAAARADGLDRSVEFLAFRALNADLTWSNTFADRVRRDIGTPTPEELQALYNGKRETYRGTFEEERPALGRALAAERVTTLAAARMAAARERFPVTFIASP